MLVCCEKGVIEPFLFVPFVPFVSSFPPLLVKTVTTFLNDFHFLHFLTFIAIEGLSSIKHTRSLDEFNFNIEACYKALIAPNLRAA